MFGNGKNETPHEKHGHLDEADSEQNRQWSEHATKSKQLGRRPAYLSG
jgi:hypothetical protein